MTAIMSHQGFGSYHLTTVNGLHLLQQLAPQRRPGLAAQCNESWEFAQGGQTNVWMIIHAHTMESGKRTETYPE